MTEALELQEVKQNLKIPDEIVVKRTSKFHSPIVQIVLAFWGWAITSAEMYCLPVALIAMTDINSKFQQFNWDSQIKSYILTSAMWSFLAFQLLAGYVINKLNTHTVIFGSAFLSSAICLIIPLAAQYLDWGGVIACNILIGFAQSFIMPGVHVFFAKWAPAGGHTRLGSFLIYAPNFGNIISLPISGAIASSDIGWPGVFYFFGVLGILWTVIFYFIGANPLSHHQEVRTEENDNIEESLNSSKSCKEETVKTPWKSIITSGAVWALILNFASQGAFYFIYSSKVPAYMKSVLLYDIEESGIMSAVPFIIGFIFIFIFGWLSDFALKKDYSIGIVRKIVNSTGSFGVAALLIVLCLVPINIGATSRLIILTAMLAFESANYCGIYINHIDIAPNFAGNLVAMLESVDVLAGQITLLLCGYIVRDETNVDQWNIIFYLIAGLFIVSNTIFIIFGKAEVQPWNNPTYLPVKKI